MVDTFSSFFSVRAVRRLLSWLPGCAALLVAGLLMVGGGTPARAEVAVPAAVVDSSRAIRRATEAPALRRPDARRVGELRARADLRYHPPGYQPDLTWWERFWQWFWRKIGRATDATITSPTTKVLWYGGLIAILAWAILKILGLDITTVFGRAPRAAPAYDVELAESPFTDDLAVRLADAEARGDYRLAVRLGYLAALRQLTDRELIHWLPEKTNLQYLRELPAGPLRDAFAPLTRQFELAWYGELIPSAAGYAAFRDIRAALTRALGVASPVSQAAA